MKHLFARLDASYYINNTFHVVMFNRLMLLSAVSFPPRCIPKKLHNKKNNNSKIFLKSTVQKNCILRKTTSMKICKLVYSNLPNKETYPFFSVKWQKTYFSRGQNLCRKFRHKNNKNFKSQYL